MDSVADQLIGLFVSRFYSMFTLPPTSRPDCSSLVLHRQRRRLLLGPRILRARGLSGHTSPHGRRQLRRCSDLAAYAGDSSVLGPRRLRQGLLGAWTSPPTLGTPRCSDLAAYAGDSSLLGARSSPATPRTPRSSVLGHCQRRQDSSLLGARSLPATLGTPRSLVLGRHQ